MREGELVSEVDDQSIVNYEREARELVREVEDQSAMTYEREVGQSDRRYLCWICGDRPFNARHQLVDHIEGAGGGGKSHLKMRKRWIEAGQPMREDWLQILENAMTEGNICFSEESVKRMTALYVLCNEDGICRVLGKDLFQIGVILAFSDHMR